jgi:hypothetical protein
MVCGGNGPVVDTIVTMIGEKGIFTDAAILGLVMEVAVIVAVVGLATSEGDV